MLITRRLEFDAGHRIPQHQSQCRHLHGHRYALEITLSAEVIHDEGASDDGMVMDFGEIKRIASEKLVNLKLNQRGLNLMRDWQVCLEDYVEIFRADYAQR